MTCLTLTASEEKFASAGPVWPTVDPAAILFCSVLL